VKKGVQFYTYGVFTVTLIVVKHTGTTPLYSRRAHTHISTFILKHEMHQTQGNTQYQSI